MADRYRSAARISAAIWAFILALALVVGGSFVLDGWPGTTVGIAAGFTFLVATITVGHELAKPCRPLSEQPWSR